MNVWDAAAMASQDEAYDGPDDRSAVHREFTEAFATVMVESGLPRMPARVLAYLLGSDTGEATTGELLEALQVSPAGVSGAVSYLTQTRLVARGRKPGDRKDTYHLTKGEWYDDIMSGRSAELLRWAAVSRRGADALGHATPAGTRLDETARFFEFLDREMAGIMDRWHAEQGRQ
jgi:hypothetical protein